jgi:hypothetical protein
MSRVPQTNPLLSADWDRHPSKVALDTLPAHSNSRNELKISYLLALEFLLYFSFSRTEVG